MIAGQAVCDAVELGGEWSWEEIGARRRSELGLKLEINGDGAGDGRCG